MGVTGGDARSAGMRIYRLPDYALVAEDRDYGDFVKWAESDPTGSRLATGSWDGFIRLYDLSGLTAQDASSPRPIAPVSKLRPPGGQRPVGLALSPMAPVWPSGSNLNPKVDVLEVKGNTLTHAYSPDTTGIAEAHEIDLRTVAWSSDGRFLYAAGGYRLKGVRQIRKWADGGRGQYRDLPMEVDLPFLHILPLRAGGIAYCSRDGSFGLLSDKDEPAVLAPKASPSTPAIMKGFSFPRTVRGSSSHTSGSASHSRSFR